MMCWTRASAMASATTGLTSLSRPTTGDPAAASSACRATYCATAPERTLRSAFCWSVNQASSRFRTRTVTMSSVSASTATSATVRRPWKVRGMSRRRRFGSRIRRLPVASALGEGVADTPHRQDEHRHGRSVLYLVAQMADVDVDGLIVLVEGFVVAQQLEQLAAGVDTARPGRQVAQDLELGRGQADAVGAALHASPLEVDDQVLVADHPAPAGVGEVAVRAAQQRLDPAHQLAQAERLRQVVVG